jgi:hypothetical protein
LYRYYARHSRPFHIGLAYNAGMKTEEILSRMAAEETGINALSHHWPWLLPDSNQDDVVVTLFEGLILEDGSTIPDIGINPPTGP